MTLLGPAKSKVGRGSQFPSQRRLLGRQFKRTHKATLSLTEPRSRSGRQKISFDAQQLRHIEQIAVGLNKSNSLIDCLKGLIKPSRQRETFHQRYIERRRQ